MIWKDSDARSQNHGILRFQTGVLEDDRLDALKCLWMKLTSGKPGRLVAQPLPNHGHFSQMELSNATTICRKPQWGGQYSSPLRNKPGTLVAEPRAVMNLWRADSKEHVSGLVELYECM